MKTLPTNNIQVDFVAATTNLIDYYDIYTQQLISSKEIIGIMEKSYEQQMSTTISTITTTTAAPNTSVCSQTFTVKNSDNLALKTLCFVNLATKINHDSALTYCRSAGMEFAGITSIDDFNGIVSFTEKVFGIYAFVPLLIINGIYDATQGVWFVKFSGKSIPMSSIVTPNVTTPTYMILKATFNGWQFKTSSSVSSDFFCEYGWNAYTLPLAPNVSICDGIFDVRTASNLLMKKVCYVPTTIRTSDARTYCRSQNMEYFGVTSFDEYRVITNYYNSRFTNERISINGAYDSSVNKWFATYTTGVTSFTTSKVEVFPPAVPDYRDYNCLAISGGQFVSTSCSDSTSFFCEFSQTVAKSQSCRMKYNITNADGSIAKKLCLIARPLDWADVSKLCRSTGLDGIFAIRNVDEYNSLNATLLSYQPANSSYWIDGVSSANGTWYNYNPDPTPLYSGAIPLSGTGTNLRVICGLNFFGTIASSAFQNGSAENYNICEYGVACRTPRTTMNSLTRDLPCGKKFN